MSTLAAAGAIVGAVGAYQGYQAQQQAQQTREDQTQVLREHLDVARDKKNEYAEALAAVNDALEKVGAEELHEISEKSADEVGKGLKIDEKV
ncbi:hypothetical protein LRD18_04590 [Halorhodospira halochloris]|uniref:Uncharacterized protein n=1 Tax=Halorhodospira halochloris TaxID=1052 RepID=A0A110B4W5_HALHR|nr:hypothetical protein [Halorhodospira halochloris]MBK1651501.1 hypothetical protein [Halorhodospira halochloris]MCG5530151.1 hypothetical protein [Halorhodospira halochloris]MCG5548009.1 hypothetical protein [Halorhodospira halochloris]BAU57235.1 hypothetical protein HH1059_05510 [Halorhodospira halochloris]